jgi:hypothetical protein
LLRVLEVQQLQRHADRRDDLGLPDRFDVYYGMADNRIGVARLDLPEHLPSGALADLQRA